MTTGVAFPFPPEGIACPRCATRFMGGRTEGRVIGDRWFLYIDCAGCFATLHVYIGGVEPDGIAPWHLVEVAAQA